MNTILCPLCPRRGGHDVEYNGKTYAVRSNWEFGQPLFSGTINGRGDLRSGRAAQQIYRLFHNGSQADVMVMTPRAAELTAIHAGKSPAGYVQISAFSHAGPAGVAGRQGRRCVKAGEELAVLEAMKMENTLHAERDGVVARINFEPGASLAVDDKILELE